jgi:probable rRNA maturation factor
MKNMRKEEVTMIGKVKVIIENNQKEVKIPTGMRMLVRRSCNAVLNLEAFEGSAEVSVTFVSMAEIRELNLRYRGIDAPTDVLSFPLGEDGEYDVNLDTGAYMLGDVVICMQKAVEQAKLYDHSLQREVGFLTAHSMLHLLGYDHEQGSEEAELMREKERQVMEILGLPRVSQLGVP